MSTQPPHRRDVAARYFAIPDPLDPDRMTYWWRKSAGAEIVPWPPKTPYRSLARSDVAHLAPAELREFVQACFDVARAAEREIVAAIEADPGPAAHRFAALKTGCCCCGRGLTDERSKVYGIGPDCRSGASEELLAMLVDAVGRAHAETSR